MFGKNSTIKKYKYRLRPALAKSYGGSATYTKEQVDKTVDEMGIDKRHIHYAYLMYCDAATYEANTPKDESIDSMNSAIASLSGIGLFGAIFSSSYYGGGEGGTGGGDGGGSGE
ncbi:hypothetical protein HII17_00585 [Thalassotalea sp. M1531]|uniref:Uncharacterized protein n=1 Tax=Thalassotalea algicola TaxID=2716224 RepID=A0A7Y0L9P7_9GAMM|nr:DUF6559 family protein [Thalassotalea algicola]NMP30042.1 hypothetical protein [Thalassotalea algicola]